MKILALDTATEACSVSLGMGDRVIERYVELGRGHAERLLPMVDEVLAEGGLTLRSLDAIAFGRGPGGFTGVRLAASVAQGLAFGAGLGVVPISNLAAVAQRAAQKAPDVAQVLVVNDARMREVYWALFRIHAGVATDAEHVGPAATVVLPEGGAVRDGSLNWAAAGRGLQVYPELAARCAERGAQVFPDLLPHATEILSLARPAVAAGQLLDPADALPVYVRDRVAEPSP
jgi:tRNA threonylcarbamoyladenosine biosynthesis protein TsaB